MKKPFLLLLPGLFVLSACFPKPNGNDAFVKTVLRIVDDKRTQLYYDKNYLPFTVTRAFSDYRERPFLIANPGEPFNPSDALNDLPQHRLVFWARRNSACVLCYEAGGRSLTVKVVYFSLQNGQLKNLQVVTLNGVNGQSVEVIKAKLREKTFWRVTDWRFT